MDTDNSLPYVPKNLAEAIRHFADPDTARDFVARLRWPDGIECPYCSGRAFNFIRASQKWHCKTCKKRFSVKKGTIFEDSPIGLDKWLTAMWMLTSCRNGVSSCEIARAIGVTQRTGWFMLHRIRFVMQSGSLDKLDGTVEVDEAVFGGLEKFKHENKRGNIGGGSGGKEIAFGFYQRNGVVKTVHVPDTKRDTLQAEIRTSLEPGSTVYSDTYQGYKSLADEYTHDTVNHRIGQYAKHGGEVTTNHMENVWSVYKRATKGSYIHFDPKHMHRYLSEFDYRYNVRDAKDGMRLVATTTGVAGKRLTWKALTAKASR